MIKVILIFLGLVQGAWALNTYEQKQATWVFSGMVVNEHGDHYGYLFEMQRVQEALQVTAALFDAQTHQVLLREEAHETIASQDESSFNWHVGNAFLHFNPINETWIFGVKTKEKKGFNFKVDTLTAPEQLAKPILFAFGYADEGGANQNVEWTYSNGSRARTICDRQFGVVETHMVFKNTRENPSVRGRSLSV
jgi:hypothetical protein